MQSVLKKPSQMLFRALLALGAVLAIASIFAPPSADAAEERKTFVLTSGMCSTAGTSKAVTIYKGSTDYTVGRVTMIRDTDFAGIVDAGPSITAYTIEVGKAGNTTKYQAATDVFTGVSNGTANGIVNTGPGIEAAGTALIATCRSTSANLNVATAGRVTFKIDVSPL